jgi:hypothetical protein
MLAIGAVEGMGDELSFDVASHWDCWCGMG